MKDLKTTNTLLLIITIPIVFYILKALSFILIPLVLSMFIALLFLPLMRWLKKHRVHKVLSIIIVVLIITGFFFIASELFQLSSREILSSKDDFFDKAEVKLTSLFTSTEGLLGIEQSPGDKGLTKYFQNGNLIKNFGSTVDFIGSTISMTLMVIFFTILWLAESINFQKVLNSTILKHDYASVKAFVKIENNLIKFMKVKFFISLFTGIGTGLACYFFDVSFPIFWGTVVFAINFLQMVGSVISVIVLSIFAFVELDPTSTLFFFISSITLVQVLFGGILEPIFMGKSFSINIITILVMLMFWGFIWGVPGLIMSIPITVFIKIILEQYKRTKVIADLMS